ncbi:4Fe-4S dicluster domain-containing protein [Chloroflexota bacterium]
MGKKCFIIDTTKCTICYNCFLTCKDEFVDHAWPPYSAPQPDTDQFWVKVDEVERGQFPIVKSSFITLICQHCEDPRCMKAANNGAIYKRDDGLVIIDPVKSKGQKQLVEACPYDRIYWNEELDIPQKCTGCAHLLDQGWAVPRCVEACPTEALLFGDEEEFSDLIKQAEKLHPEYNTKPSTYYIGLPKTFIAGSVYDSDSKECVEKAKVTITDKASVKSFDVKTDNYGDFILDDLKADSVISLNIEANGYYPFSIDDIPIKKDLTLRDIYLVPTSSIAKTAK